MNQWQNDRIKFMKVIAQEVSKATGDALVLKGGTALLLGYRLNRFSEDMDFDAKRQIDLKKSIQMAAAKCGIKIEDINLKKDTETTKRYMVHYGAERAGGDYPLKIECSFRQAASMDEKNVVMIDGMRIYHIEKLAEQKIFAFLNREKARDIYDVHFLLTKYPEAFSSATLQQLRDGIKERGVDALLKVYEDDASTDHILRRSDPIEIVLDIEQRVKNLTQAKERVNDLPDKYTYPDTECLKNKFGVKDTILLHAYERKYVTVRAIELAENPIPGNFDLKHLQQIHEHLFQDVYTWAGKIREIDIGKVDQMDQKLHEFCPSHQIEGFAEDITRSIRKANYLKEMDKDQFAQKGAQIMGELNELHPFREGNGRTQREFMRELAANAGWELNFDGISKERMIEASVAAMRMDYRHLEDIIKESLKPLHMELTPEYQKRIQEIEAAPEKSKSKLVSTKELYNMYAKKALASNHGVWKPELDKEVVLAMKKAGIDDLKIHTALNHSPSMLGMSGIEKNIKSRTLVREIAKEHPELQKGRGLSR